MNINLRLTGVLERFINERVRRGIAASKTEAVRFAVAECYERESGSIKSSWNNPIDDKAAEFYERKYLRGKKKR